MKLIVGLGNVGEQYNNTRHNTGFEVINNLVNIFKINNFKQGFKGTYSFLNNYDCIFFKPSTFMNLSGLAVKEIVFFFKIKISDILVILDDMALPVGKIRLRESGTSAGHKGLQNIFDNLGTEKIKRLRVGIGKPTNCSISQFVLTKPDQNENFILTSAINKASEAVVDYLKINNFQHVMNKFN